MSWLMLLMTFASIQLAATSNLEKRADFKILRPRSGDIIVADDNDYSFNITWTNNTLDYNASISLRQGPPNDLQQVAVVNASTLNNGSFLWTGWDDDWLRGFGTTNPSSGCNYSMEISAGGERVLSEYFTVVYEEDGGLDTTVECPSGAPNITDTNSRTAYDGNNNDNKDKNGTSSQDGSSATGSSGGGISTIVLGAVIAGVAAFIIILFTVLFCIGRKKGWIVMGRNRRTAGTGYQPTYNTATEFKAMNHPATNNPHLLGTKASPHVEQTYLGAGDVEMNEYMRLQRKYGDAHMVMGNQLHQMPGNRDGS